MGRRLFRPNPSQRWNCLSGRDLHSPGRASKSFSPSVHMAFIAGSHRSQILLLRTCAWGTSTSRWAGFRNARESSMAELNFVRISHHAGMSLGNSRKVGPLAPSIANLRDGWRLVGPILLH
jgi:hypothetical protein